MKQLTLTSASAVVIAVIICWEVPFDAAAAAGNEASYHHQQQRRRLPRIYHRGRGNTTTKLIPSSFSFLHHYQHDQHYLYRQIRHRTSQQYQSAVADCRRGGNQLFVSCNDYELQRALQRAPRDLFHVYLLSRARTLIRKMRETIVEIQAGTEQFH